MHLRSADVREAGGAATDEPADNEADGMAEAPGRLFLKVMW